MNTTAQPQARTRGWLDSLAIGFSVACALHCLLMPVVVIAAPALATAFWAQHDFHLWLLLLVLPTSITAVFLGCRKHRDRGVVLLSLAGLSLLVVAAISEFAAHAGHHDEMAHDHAHHDHDAHAAEHDHDHAHADHHDHAHDDGHAHETHDDHEGHEHADADGHHHDHHPGGTALTLLGALILSGAHVRNFWLCRRANR